MIDRADDLHDNGVHTACRFPAKKTGGAVGIRPSYHDGMVAEWCIKAGSVDRYHSHDFEGTLYDACGCEELGS
jgi:hypothetical protein